jgi:transposase
LEHSVITIGIDPHKGSHTATAVDASEAVVGELRVTADRHQRARLLEWAARFEPRRWAIEGATGMGALLAQQLVGAGEHVVDVPPKLSARVRLMGNGRIDKTDPNDARSAAIVAVRNATLNSVGAEGEHRVVLRLLATATTSSPPNAPAACVASMPCCACSSRAAPVGPSAPAGP